MRAELTFLLGNAYNKIGAGHLARPLLEASVELSRAFGPEAIAPLFRLGDEVGFEDPQRRLALYREAIRLSEDHEAEPGIRSWALVYLAAEAPPNTPEADSLLRAAIAPPAWLARGDPAHGWWPEHAVRIQQTWGQVASTAVDTSRTLPVLREGRAAALRGGWDALAAFVLFTEAHVRARYSPAEAIPLYEAARREAEAAHGREHSRWIWMTRDHARVLLEAGQSERALALADSAVAVSQAVLGKAPNWNAVDARMDRARIRRALGDPARDDLREVLAAVDVLGAGHPIRAEASNLLRTPLR